MIRWPCWLIRLRRLRHRRSFVAVEPRRRTAQVHNLVLSDTDDGRISLLLENKLTEITKAVGKGVRSAGTRPQWSMGWAETGTRGTDCPVPQNVPAVNSVSTSLKPVSPTKCVFGFELFFESDAHRVRTRLRSATRQRCRTFSPTTASCSKWSTLSISSRRDAANGN